MAIRSAYTVGVLAVLAGAAAGDELPLQYNWNAMAHPSEFFMPIHDRPMGFRVIGDRALIFGETDSLGGASGRVTTAMGTYQLVTSPDTTDCLFFGSRTPADASGWDDEEDTDNLGVAPAWDPTSGSGVLEVAETVFASPVTLTDGSAFSFLYHATQGGGEFDLTLGFTDGTSVTVTVHAPDWFADGNPSPNAPLAGVESQAIIPGPLSSGDGFVGSYGNDVPFLASPLNACEAVISADAILSGTGFDVRGRSLESVVFDGTTLVAEHDRVAVAVYAMLLDGVPVEMDTNWNGAVHQDELNLPVANEPDGFRSISDRGLTVGHADSAGGTAYTLIASGMDYHLSDAASVPDTVMIGQRGPGYDDQVNNNQIGTVPAWDVTGGTREILLWDSFLPDPVELAADTKIGFLYHATNGGGDFFVTLNFTDGDSLELLLNSGDWFADFDPEVVPPDLGVELQRKLEGPLSDGDGFEAVGGYDTVTIGSPLSLFEAVVSVDSLLSDWGFDAEGRRLDSITFDGLGIGSRAVAVYAVSIGNGTASGPCSAADLAVPYGTLDIDDVLAFLSKFASSDPAADLVTNGTLDIDDVLFFLTAFANGCG